MDTTSTNNENDINNSRKYERTVRKDQTSKGDGTSASNEDIANNSRSYEKLWQQSYTKSLTCRGRVDWIMKNDTLVEYYHLPKTCEKMRLSKAGKEDALSSDLYNMIPLIQQGV